MPEIRWGGAVEYLALASSLASRRPGHVSQVPKLVVGKLIRLDVISLFHGSGVRRNAKDICMVLGRLN